MGGTNEHESEDQYNAEESKIDDDGAEEGQSVEGDASFTKRDSSFMSNRGLVENNMQFKRKKHLKTNKDELAVTGKSPDKKHRSKKNKEKDEDPKKIAYVSKEQQQAQNLQRKESDA